MEMAKCMMHEKGFLKKFQVEAANITVFLLNKLPTKAMRGRNPFEEWYGYKPFV